MVNSDETPVNSSTFCKSSSCLSMIFSSCPFSNLNSTFLLELGNSNSNLFSPDSNSFLSISLCCKVVKSTTRNTKAYKDVAGGELCLLQHEVDQIELMREKVMNNDICRDLIQGWNDSQLKGQIEYEVPMVTELFGNKWKGKADIVNHEEKLVIDLKTTADIDKFQWSASKYNYDSQAYIYSKLFGYEFLFIVIDKNTHQIGMFDCSPQFYERGEEKVRKASEAYDLFYKTKDFDPKQYFISKTL